jgi:hypothetical protein
LKASRRVRKNAPALRRLPLCSNGQVRSPQCCYAARGARSALRRAECLAGEFETAGALLAAAEAGPLDELGRAHAELLRAKIAFAVIVVVTPHHSF